LGLIIVAVKFYRKSRKDTKVISDEKQKNQSLQDDLSRSEQENRMNAQNLSDEKQKNAQSEKDNKELISQQLNQLIEIFIMGKTLPKQELAVTKNLKKINAILFKKGKQDEQNEDFNWETFFKYMNILHDGFPEKLKTLYPKLTEIDIRICCLSILKIRNKEIVCFLKSSNVDFIQNRKAKIRKELNMTKQISFANQLLEISKKKPL
jgi:hypothetical protein